MKVTALLFKVEEPPEFATDDFPLVSLYAIIEVEGEHIVYVPEDDQIIRGAEALAFIAKLAPITTFGGAADADYQINELD